MPKPKIILGTAQIDPNYGATRSSPAEGHAIDWLKLLSKAADLGFEALDTASAYLGAHDLIRKANWQGPIHTKIREISNAEEELEEARDSLARHTIDLVYFHESSAIKYRTQEVQHVAKLLLKSGVEAVGVSVYEPEELYAALEIPEVSVIQIPANLLDQRFLGEPLQRAKKFDKKIIVRSIFLQGLLLSTNLEFSRPIPKGLREGLEHFFASCDEGSVSPLDVCLRFAAQLANVDAVILGVESLSQAVELSQAWSTLSVDITIAEKFLSSTLPASLVDPRTWQTLAPKSHGKA